MYCSSDLRDFLISRGEGGLNTNVEKQHRNRNDTLSGVFILRETAVIGTDEER